MTANQDDIDDILSLVPERDELVMHRKQKRGTSQPARSGSANDVSEAGTSGVVVFFITLLFLGMCGTGAAGYYFYQQGEQSRTALLAATNRILSLEGSLNQMDDATKQSAMTMRQKVDATSSEVDKLWSARNTLRTEVEKLSAAVTTVTKTANDLETAVTNHGSQLNQHTNQLASAQVNIEQVTKNFAGMENLGQPLTQLKADLNRVKVAMNKLEAETGKRLGGNEQDIESINVYRLQMNQTISALQTSINTLQQKVGK